MLANLLDEEFQFQPVVSHALNAAQIDDQHVALAETFVTGLDAVQKVVVRYLGEERGSAVAEAPFVAVLEHGRFDLQKYALADGVRNDIRIACRNVEINGFLFGDHGFGHTVTAASEHFDPVALERFDDLGKRLPHDATLVEPASDQIDLESLDDFRFGFSKMVLSP